VHDEGGRARVEVHVSTARVANGEVDEGIRRTLEQIGARAAEGAGG